MWKLKTYKNYLGCHKIYSPCALLIQVETRQPHRPLHQGLLHGRRVEQLPARFLWQHARKQANRACETTCKLLYRLLGTVNSLQTYNREKHKALTKHSQNQQKTGKKDTQRKTKTLHSHTCNNWGRDRCAAERAAPPLDAASQHSLSIGHHIWLGAAIPPWQLPRRHAATGKRCQSVFKIDATHANDVVLVGWVVEGAVQWAVVANGGHHDDAVGGDLKHLGAAMMVRSTSKTPQEAYDQHKKHIATVAHTLSTKGLSKWSGPPMERLMTCMRVAIA